ncbi:MAG: hypothetical protein O7G88_08220, partial [bacterium]|nr:hypothetical protein [bacterium]
MGSRMLGVKVARIPLAVTLFVAFCYLATASCTAQQLDAAAVARGRAENGVVHAANEVLDALQTRDGNRLASLVHPEKGVRFSPSAYVDIETDRVLSPDQVKRFWTDHSTYVWGYADGTGDPINLTPEQYLREYVLSRDFRQPSSINVNDDRASGNTNNNAATIYPVGTRVEYYIQPSVRDSVEQHNWAALRLVFERIGGSWFLVGVIHDQ